MAVLSWLPRGGKLAPQKLYLYNEGDECTSVTGGYTLREFYNGSSSYATLTKNASSLYFTTVIRSEVWRKRGFATSNKLDFSKYSKLYVEYSSSSTLTGGGSGGMGVGVSVASTLTDTKEGSVLGGNIGLIGISKDAGANVNTTGSIASLDISSITESAYLVVYFASGYYDSGSMTINVKRIWLE